MSALEQFKHAESFAQMSLGDKLAATGQVILLGMGITFIALILIWFLTVLMSKAIRSIEKSSEVKNVKQPVVVTQKQPEVVMTSNEDDEELIAVISAAIAASLNTSVQTIRVTNIRRIQDTTPTWGQLGRSDVMKARF